MKFTIAFSLVLSTSIIAQLVVDSFGITGVMAPLGTTYHQPWLILNFIGWCFAVLMFFLSIMALYLARVFIETQTGRSSSSTRFLAKETISKCLSIASKSKSVPVRAAMA
ncbi:MAG: hypothetical protein MZU79_03000 [Anaerotruncus sp.]|nr:hypothetical protein [Anaerotruncus sp.]